MYKDNQKLHKGGNILQYVKKFLKQGNTRKCKKLSYFNQQPLIVILDNLNTMSISIFIKSRQKIAKFERKRRNCEGVQYQESCMGTL